MAAHLEATKARLDGSFQWIDVVGFSLLAALLATAVLRTRNRQYRRGTRAW
ncbi:UNVERIFIED_ORG: hypothetical protein ABIB19_001682 [Arthrobacter sp. UYEF10]